MIVVRSMSRVRYNGSMSWASRRRFAYATGVIVFFGVVVGGPIAYRILSKPATCFDGIRNQGETDVDKGGPCEVLDPRVLQNSSILWSRSFSVRSGSYNAVAYLQNPNDSAGVRSVHYRFGLYDDQNVLVAEKTGDTSVMPGGVTPVFSGSIETGNRVVSHTYFEFAENPLWERLNNAADVVKLNNIQLKDPTTAPRLTATVLNKSVNDVTNLTFVATIFDPSGNAFAASQTALAVLHGGEAEDIIFSWPQPFRVTVGRIDIIPVAEPVPPKKK